MLLVAAAASIASVHGDDNQRQPPHFVLFGRSQPVLLFSASFLRDANRRQKRTVLSAFEGFFDIIVEEIEVYVFC